MNRLPNDIESAPAEVLRRLQEEKLQAQIQYLQANSPLMREKLRTVGADPHDIRTLDDLARLPFTTKEELRNSQVQAPPFGLHVAAPRDSIVRVHASSGTTGTPSYVGVTEHDRRTWVEAVSRAYWSQGLRPAGVLAMGFGIGFFVGGVPISEAATRIGCMFVPVGTGASERLLSSIRSLGADCLTCTPSYAAYLAEYGRTKMDLDVATLGIKRLFVGAEPGGGIPEVRRNLGELWNASVSESVGNADVIPIHSAECEHRQGNHFLVPDYLILEIIDPVTGKVQSLEADTLSGEMVFTHIDRQCVPLLRFRTYDQVEVDTRPCPCGRTGPRIRCVGRTDDMLIIRGTNVWPSAIKDVIMSMRPRTNGEVQILLDKPGPSVQPPLRLQIEAEGTVTALEALRHDAETLLREKLIFTSRVEIVPVGSLPRYEMKARLIRKLWLEKQ
ncbi:MAG: phenylacetate--CoA ligase family protein [Gammaproteobacteria bacterium]